MTRDTFIISALECTYTNGTIKTTLLDKGSKKFIDILNNDGDTVEFIFDISKTGFYKLSFDYSLPTENAVHRCLINDEFYGDLSFKQTEKFILLNTITSIKLEQGKNKVTLLRSWGHLNLRSLVVDETEAPAAFNPTFALTNPKASKESLELMNFFKKIHGKRILSGQHCNKSTCPDFEFIKRKTGKFPAILGFDLLSYSSAIDTKESSWDCIDEIANNRGSVEVALKYAKETNCIITFCWHWFSPLHGRDKSFYTENTTFDIEKALSPDSLEYMSMIKDMDMIADQLKLFKAANVPILFRPLHEAHGSWFWWGAKGPKPYIELYRLMYDRFTNLHQLNNLIWVWNATFEEYYPGDNVVDINSRDIYGPMKNYGPLTYDFYETALIPTPSKPMALGENGSIPNPNLIKESNTPWLWFMTWNNFLNNDYNELDKVIEFFNDPHVINLEDLDSYFPAKYI